MVTVPMIMPQLLHVGMLSKSKGQILGEVSAFHLLFAMGMAEGDAPAEIEDMQELCNSGKSKG